MLMNKIKKIEADLCNLGKRPTVSILKLVCNFYFFLSSKTKKNMKPSRRWERPGRLSCRVQKGENLRNVQNGRFLFGEQDPFVKGALVIATAADLEIQARKQDEKIMNKIIFGSNEQNLSESRLVAQSLSESQWERTRAIDHGGKNPVWENDIVDDWGRSNELFFRFPGRDSARPDVPIRLFLRVMDSERLGNDREIGIGALDVVDTLKSKNSATGLRCELEDQAGFIVVDIFFEEWPVACSQGILHLDIAKATNLRRVSTFSREDPFCQVELHPWKTKVRTRTSHDAGRNPDWHEEGGTLAIAFPGLETKHSMGLGLKLTVYDEEKLHRNRAMGTAWLDILHFIEKAFSEEKEENEAERVTLSLWDCHHCVKPAGVLEMQVLFRPSFSNFDQSIATNAQASKKRALLIGINYTNQEGELRGCHNDALEIQAVLQGDFGVEEIKLLIDGKDSKKFELPTAANIRAGLKWLLDGAQSGDHLFLHYSGHGSQVPDEDNDEEDGKDEILVPLDMDWNNPKSFISDDELRSGFFEKVPKGVDLTVVFDCCHSGTMSDLKLFDKPLGGFLVPEVKNDRSNDDSETRSRFLPPPKFIQDRINQLRQSRSSASLAMKRLTLNKKVKDGSSILVISGCRDDQTAADAKIDGKFMGATTWSLRRVMSQKGTQISVAELLFAIQENIRSKGWSQVPQLSLSSMKSASTPWMDGWGSLRAEAGHEIDEEKTKVGDQELPPCSEQERHVQISCMEKQLDEEDEEYDSGIDLDVDEMVFSQRQVLQQKTEESSDDGFDFGDNEDDEYDEEEENRRRFLPQPFVNNKENGEDLSGHDSDSDEDDYAFIEKESAANEVHGDVPESEEEERVWKYNATTKPRAPAWRISSNLNYLRILQQNNG